MQVKHFAGFALGQSVVHNVGMTKELIDAYANVVGDHNPLHTDDAYATPRFGGIIAHGTLLIGLFSAAMCKLLGPGVVARTFKCKFKSPIRPGDTVRLEVRIVDLIPKIRKVVVEGRASVGSTLVVTTTIEALSET